MPSWSTSIDGATVVAEMGFGFAPSVAVGATTFTAITGDVRDCDIRYGRLNERDDYQAGTMTLSVGNVDREFDPLHAGGPHFGQLLPGCRIRVKVTVAAVTVALYTGYVTQLPQIYDMGGDSVVVIQAVDGFSVLQRATLPSLYAYEVKADTPSLWWRLGEQQGTVAVDSSGNGVDGTYVGGAVFGTRAGLIVDSDTAIGFTTTTTATAIFTWPVYPFSVELWVNGPVPAISTANHKFLAAENGGNSFSVDDVSGGLALYYTTPAGTTQVQIAASVLDATTHHVLGTFTSAGTAPSLYIDGVLRTPSLTSTTGTGALGAVSVSTPRQVADLFSVVLDEIAVYSTALSGARALAHYNAGATPFRGLDTGAVVNKILDMVGWPTADRTIETGKSTVTSINTAGRSALEVIKDMEKTEQGRFFIAPDGKATFYNRHHTLTASASLTVQSTFGEAAGERPYVGIETDYGDTYIRNKVTAQRAGGSPYVVSDATSLAAYGEYNDTVTGLLNSSDGEIRDLASWRLGHYKDPATRITSLTVNPRIQPVTTFPVVRDRKLLDRVTVKRRPGPIGAPVGAAISIDVLIEGVQHRISADQTWATTYSLSPAEVQSYLVLDHATLGQLGNNKLAY